jgi:hypothetical protein
LGGVTVNSVVQHKLVFFAFVEGQEMVLLLKHGVYDELVGSWAFGDYSLV